MSVYNDERFVSRAVESVLGQTEGDFELVIVDDGSTDTSTDILRHLTDKRVRVYRQRNDGVAGALNRAISEATGEMLARQDADDESLPTRFAAQLAYLDSHPEVDAVGAGFEQIDDRGRRQGTFPGVTDLTYLEDLLLVDNPFMHGSMMIRAETMKRMGGYARVACEDFELWTRLAAEGRMANLSEVLYRWRWHEHAVTKRNASGLMRDAEEIRKKYLAKRLEAEAPMWPPGDCAVDDPLLANRLAYDYFELGRLFFGIEEFERARFYLELAQRLDRRTIRCLWNRLYCSKYRIRRRELARMAASCRRKAQG